MSDSTRDRHRALRTTLTDIAERWILAEGPGRLKARLLAAEAGCSVGAIYTVFADLDELVMEVNLRTFRRMGSFIAGVLEQCPDRDPRERLVAMSCAYLQFAAANTFAWRCLFALEVSDGSDVPDWYQRELGALFALISATLAEIYPQAPRPRIDLLTRTLFSSVHGIVLLGLERRISAVPRDHLEEMIALLLRNVTSQQTVS